jgi:hypothetical protein
LTRRREAGVFRVIPIKIVTLDELSEPPVSKKNRAVQGWSLDHRCSDFVVVGG